MGIRSNWLQALRKAAPGIIETPSPTEPIPPPPTATNSNTSSAPSSTSSSRQSTASSSQLTAAAVAVITAHQSPAPSPIRLRGDTSCRLSTGSSSGGGTPTTPRSGVMMFSSDEEYRTASEGGRRDSMTDVDWGDCTTGGAANMGKNLLNRSNEQRIQRSRPHKLPRCQSSRQSTLDSNISSPDELDSNVPSYNSNNNQSIQSPSSKGDDIGSPRMYYRHSVADMRTRKLHLQLQLDEEGEVQRRRRGDSVLEKELEVARGEVRALEEEARRLRGLLGESASKELKSRDAMYELEKIERDLTLKMEKLLREQKSLNRRLSESDEAIRESDDRSATLNRELQAKQRIVCSLQEELTCANERCAASRLENDRLYKKLQELNTTPTPTPTITAPHHPTISHLTNIDLDAPLTALSTTELTHHCLDVRMRFERAIAEIRELQQRLREAHAQVDVLQLERLRFGQRVEAARDEYEGRLGMLKGSVEDLTGKLLQMERARLRGVPVNGGRGQRSESSGGSVGKVGRRSLSLKGRESFSLNKEVEDKVTLLEAKLLSLENPGSTSAVGDRGRAIRRYNGKYATSSSGRRSTDNGSPIDDRSLRRLRRKSLDGATASEPMKLLMRLNALEEKVGAVSGRASTESLNNTTTDCCSVRVEESSEMDSLSQARDMYVRCVTTSGYNTPDGHMRELGRILRVPDNSLPLNDERDVVAASAQSLVGQLERTLKRQYTELHERRHRMRMRGELDGTAKMELLAEKIAFEDVIIGRILEAIKNKSTFLTRQTMETQHLLNHLRTKLSPTAINTPIMSTYLHSSGQYLTQLFTRQLLSNMSYNARSSDECRMDDVDAQQLLRERSKVQELLGEYQRVKLVALADRLAADTVTLATDDSCSLVEEVRGRVWDVARRRVSEELIQSEVRHVFMKTAQHYEDLNSSDNTAGYSFTISAIQRCQIEQWTDSVEEHLLARMESFITDLNNTYQTSLNHFPTSKPNEQSTVNSSVLLHEYADIMAHVALVDARIATLQFKSSITTTTTMEDTACLKLLLDAEDGKTSLNEISIAEFKAALQCAQQRVMASKHGADMCVGTSSNSYDSVSSDFPPPLDPNATSPPPQTTYHHQIALLRDAFQQTLATYNLPPPTTDSHAVTTRDYRQRHLHLVESSVERLRVVCEQVLVAMERMHRTALQRMRVSHNEEMDGVRRDKEQALAEETQATLAALDAMRKAHEAEVVREVARFKQELARQQASELLDLRERLSVKCLEAAALQEQLGSATRQLAHAHQHILHLEQQRAPTAS